MRAGCRPYPYAQRFFVSRTRFYEDQYRYATLEPLLGPLGIRYLEYQKVGLFVLRSTVMNPFYFAARDIEPAHDIESAPDNESEATDYLFDFVHELHAAARTVLDRLESRDPSRSVRRPPAPWPKKKGRRVKANRFSRAR